MSTREPTEAEENHLDAMYRRAAVLFDQLAHENLDERDIVIVLGCALGMTEACSSLDELDIERGIILARAFGFKSAETVLKPLGLGREAD